MSEDKSQSAQSAHPTSPPPSGVQKSIFGLPEPASSRPPSKGHTLNEDYVMDIVSEQEEIQGGNPNIANQDWSGSSDVGDRRGDDGSNTDWTEDTPLGAHARSSDGSASPFPGAQFPHNVSPEGFSKRHGGLSVAIPGKDVADAQSRMSTPLASPTAAVQTSVEDSPSSLNVEFSEVGNYLKGNYSPSGSEGPPSRTPDSLYASSNISGEPTPLIGGSGASHLFDAVRNNQPEQVRQFLRDCTDRKQIYIALEIAEAEGHVDVSEVLLMHVEGLVEKYPEQTSSDRRSPSADPQPKATIESTFVQTRMLGVTIAAPTCMFKKSKVSPHLGFVMAIQKSDIPQIYRETAKSVERLNEFIFSDMTPLMIVCRSMTCDEKCIADVIDDMVRHGADPRLPNKDQETAWDFLERYHPELALKIRKKFPLDKDEWMPYPDKMPKLKIKYNALYNSEYQSNPSSDDADTKWARRESEPINIYQSNISSPDVMDVMDVMSDTSYSSSGSPSPLALSSDPRVSITSIMKKRNSRQASSVPLVPRLKLEEANARRSMPDLPLHDGPARPEMSFGLHQLLQELNEARQRNEKISPLLASSEDVDIVAKFGQHQETEDSPRTNAHSLPIAVAWYLEHGVISQDTQVRKPTIFDRGFGSEDNIKLRRENIRLQSKFELHPDNQPDLKKYVLSFRDIRRETDDILFLYALLLLIRWIKGNTRIDNLNVHRLWLAAFMVSMKTLQEREDKYIIRNKDFSRFIGVTNSELLDLEVQFMVGIEFSLRITPQELDLNRWLLYKWLYAFAYKTHKFRDIAERILGADLLETPEQFPDIPQGEPFSGVSDPLASAAWSDSDDLQPVEDRAPSTRLPSPSLAALSAEHSRKGFEEMRKNPSFDNFLLGRPAVHGIEDHACSFCPYTPYDERHFDGTPKKKSPRGEDLETAIEMKSFNGSPAETSFLEETEKEFKLRIDYDINLSPEYNFYNPGLQVSYWLQFAGQKQLVGRGIVNGVDAQLLQDAAVGAAIKPYGTAFLQPSNNPDYFLTTDPVLEDGGFPSPSTLNAGQLNDFHVKTTGGVPSSWRDRTSLSTWIGTIPVVPGVLWCLAHLLFITAFALYVAVRYKYITQDHENIDCEESVISRESVIARNGSRDTIEPDQSKDHIPPLQAQRNLKVTLYRTWWPCTALYIFWFCILVGTVITGYLVSAGAISNMMLLYTIIASMLVVEAVTYLWLSVSLGEHSRFGLVLADGLDNATCVFVEEQGAMPVSLSLWHKKNGKKLGKKCLVPKSICANTNTPFLPPKSFVIDLQYDDSQTYFTFGGVRYSYSTEHKAFVTHDYTTLAIRQAVQKIKTGLPDDTVQRRRAMVGPNTTITPHQNIYRTLAKVVLYDPVLFALVFGTFALPYCPYRFYDLVQVGMLVASLVWATKVYSRKQMATVCENGADVLRDGRWSWVPESGIVPGDIYKVVPHQIIPCDSCLLNNDIYIDESLITGSPFPQLKIALSGPKCIFGQLQLCAHHQLYAGSKILNCPQSGTYAVCTEVGSCTFKGQMTQLALRFQERVVGMKKNLQRLLIFACCVKIVNVLFRSIGILVTYFPASTPGAVRCLATIYYFFSRIIARDAYLLCANLTMFVHAWLWSREFAARMLKRLGIATNYIRSLPVAGYVNTFIFDKTKTLTKGDMNIKYVVPVFHEDNEDSDHIYSSCARFEPIVNYFTSTHERLCWTDSLSQLWRAALGSCHACSLDNDGNLQGSNIDLSILNSTKWQFKPPHITANDHTKPMEIIRTLPFDSDTNTSGVVVQHGDKMLLFIKGAFEGVLSKSKAGTVPFDCREKYEVHLQEENGQNYILGMGVRELCDINVFTAKRSDLERELTFMGFLVFHDQVKPEARQVLNELSNANIPSIIATGDDVQSAIFIGKQVGILSNNTNDLEYGDNNHTIIVLGHMVQEREFKQSKLCHFFNCSI